jgi:hypothetical protein
MRTLRHVACRACQGTLNTKQGYLSETVHDNALLPAKETDRIDPAEFTSSWMESLGFKWQSWPVYVAQTNLPWVAVWALTQFYLVC